MRPACDPAAVASGKDVKPKPTRMGRCLPNTVIQFEKAEGSSINLVGKSKGWVEYPWVGDTPAFSKIGFTNSIVLSNLVHCVLEYCIFIEKEWFLCRKVVRQSIINPDWDFQKMGIGGLDSEFNAIFRRAFASRVFPPEVVEQLGTVISLAVIICPFSRISWKIRGLLAASCID